MISLARSAIGFKSAYSGLTTSKYLPSGDMRFDWQNIILGDIDPPRIGRIVDVAELLQGDLPAPRQEPVDKNLGRVGVRRLIQITERTAAGRKARSLLPPGRIEIIHRQSLVLGAHGILAAKAQGVAPLGQPVGHLAEILGELDVHGAKEFFDKFRAEFRVIVEKLHGAAQTAVARIEGDDFTLPLGLRDIPIGFEFLGTHLARVKS